MLDELAADEVTVVPFLTSAGHYSEVVLPEALARNRRFGEVRLRQTPPVGTHAGVAPLVARRVTELLRDRASSARHVALVLGGPRHARGTRRAGPPPSSWPKRSAAGASRARWSRRSSTTIRRSTMRSPRSAGRTVLVVPFLIGGGAHALEDIPRRLGLAGAATWSGRVDGRRS